MQIRRLLIGLLLLAGGFEASAQSVLRLVPQAIVETLDPVWTTATETSSHGYMIYDVLFALDGSLRPKPQMVETWSKSGDGMVWRFSLRPGLTFHDGTPVEAKDAVQSLKRWAVRMVSGMTLMQHVQEVAVTGPLDFEIRLKSPFAPVLEQLSNPAVPLFVMREEEAKTDPFKQIEKRIRLRPVHLRQGRLGAGQQGRLQAVHQLRAAAQSRPTDSPAARSPRSIASSGFGSRIPRRRRRR